MKTIKCFIPKLHSLLKSICGFVKEKRIIILFTFSMYREYKECFIQNGFCLEKRSIQVGYFSFT